MKASPLRWIRQKWTLFRYSWQLRHRYAPRWGWPLAAKHWDVERTPRPIGVVLGRRGRQSQRSGPAKNRWICSSVWPACSTNTESTPTCPDSDTRRTNGTCVRYYRSRQSNTTMQIKYDKRTNEDKIIKELIKIVRLLCVCGTVQFRVVVFSRKRLVILIQEKQLWIKPIRNVMLFFNMI